MGHICDLLMISKLLEHLLREQTSLALILLG